jgi:hypothetical protein
MNRIFLFLRRFLGLIPRDYQLAMLLDLYAGDDPGCWPSVETLQRELGVKSRRTVQLALARLRKVGAITDVPGDNPTGRFILLNWRPGPGAQFDASARTNPPPIAPYVPAPFGAQSMAPDKYEEQTIRNVGCATREKIQPPEAAGPPLERSPAAADSRPIAVPAPPLEDDLAALPAKLDASPEKASVTEATGPPLERSPAAADSRPIAAPVPPLKDALAALPGEAESVESLAWRLARHFNDLHSVPFYRKILGQVARREPGFPVERLLDAFRVADRAKSSMGKPGGLFTKTWRDWHPPVRPSQINTPTYRLAERPVTVTAEANTGQGLPSSQPSPPSSEELAQAREWAALPSRNPMRRFGEMLLKKMEASAAGP